VAKELLHKTSVAIRGSRRSAVGGELSSSHGDFAIMHHCWPDIACTLPIRGRAVVPRLVGSHATHFLQ
jgi:hypothetical protein